MRPTRTPIGLKLSTDARIVRRAFDDALAEAGGSLAVWLVLLNLKIRPAANQREIAEAVGVSEATLTTQLNSMEARGLVTRRRDPENRRFHIVETTEAGQALFTVLRSAAGAFDARLRAGLTDDEIDTLASLLDRLAANAAPSTTSGARRAVAPSEMAESPVGSVDNAAGP